MKNSQLLSIKAKKFGVRLAGFRQKKGVSTETLSLWTGIPKDEIERIERGDSTISLPLIELIALKLGILTDTLLAGDFDGNIYPSPDADFNQHYSSLRDRMIALILRKNRLELKKSTDAVAKKCSITEEQLEQFETGSVSIPWPVLECLCQEYHLPINTLFSNISSNGRSPSQKEASTADIKPLPTEISIFVQNPANLPYLELAKRLSELDAAKLRSIAEGLLEITY